MKGPEDRRHRRPRKVDAALRRPMTPEERGRHDYRTTTDDDARFWLTRDAAQTIAEASRFRPPFPVTPADLEHARGVLAERDAAKDQGR